jgi:ABC-2 type transport system ATP-binding protein
VSLELQQPPAAVQAARPGAPAVSLRGVGKRFRLRDGRTLAEFVPSLMKGRGFRAPFWALHDVTFDLPVGGVIGVIGRNGSGKSTVLKLIAGVMAPTTGAIDVRGRIAPLLELGAGFHPDLTGSENIYLQASILGLPNAEIRERAGDIVDFAGLDGFMDTPVKRYSSGMLIRLAFSVIVHASPDILLVDEALAVGDAAFQEKSLERMEAMKAGGAAIVVVSHGMQTIASFCERVLVLDSGGVAFDGDAEPAIAEYMRLAGVAAEAKAVETLRR